MENWAYYNHVYHATCPPHKSVDLSRIEDGSIWRRIPKGGIPLVVRYTTDYDCETPTQWWFCVKDRPLDIDGMKSKRRYELNKGYRNFEIKEIKASDCPEKLYEVHRAALASYATPRTVDKESFISSLGRLDYYKMYGAFSTNTGELAAYAILRREDNYIAFSVLKANPVYERDGVNAAIVRYICEDHLEFLSSGGYIDDGERAIFHETHFQDYLEKYFDFRKAYCKLHIEYNPLVKPLIGIAYRFRKGIIQSSIKQLHALRALLIMEEIARGEFTE